MSDGEPMTALPEEVQTQVDRTESIVAGADYRRRKQTTRLDGLYEVDLWVESHHLERLEDGLARIGFEPFRPGRQDDHRFFLWSGAGHWIKVDVKIPHGDRPSLFADIFWLVRRRRGLVVALLGADGAGKSSAAACLQESMPIDLKIRYLGVRRRRADGPASGSQSEKRPSRAVHPARQAAGLLKWLVSVVWSTWSIQGWAWRGAVVVCDRHPIEAGLMGGEPPIVKRLKRLAVRSLLPKPDLVVLLAAPGAVLHQRKGEHTPEVLDRMTETWRSVCRESGGIEIDATATAADVCRALQRHIWLRLRNVRSR